ncbi:MAG: hypothetical protein KDI11_08315 [Alphaproteobacteria bacterium]|nr:hypothetical protein [Alphaproteobacteria bacterium]
MQKYESTKIKVKMHISIRKLGVFLVLPFLVLVSFWGTESYVSSAQASFFDKFWKKEVSQYSILAELSGFEPGAKVNYRITGPGKEPILNAAQIEQDGTLLVPAPAATQIQNKNITYDFSINEAERTVSLLLRHNVQTGTTLLNGDTDRPFTDIQIQAQDREIQMRSDWAGLFEETGIKLKANKDMAQPVQVAFYSHDIATDAREYASPSLIKILIAPGGGGPTGAGLNGWENIGADLTSADLANLSNVANNTANQISSFIGTPNGLAADLRDQGILTNIADDAVGGFNYCQHNTCAASSILDLADLAETVGDYNLGLELYEIRNLANTVDSLNNLPATVNQLRTLSSAAATANPSSLSSLGNLVNIVSNIGTLQDITTLANLTASIPQINTLANLAAASGLNGLAADLNKLAALAALADSFSDFAVSLGFCSFTMPGSTCNTAAVNAANSGIVSNYVYALMMMTEQLSAVMMQQVEIIGTFFDAKHQLESQRLQQELKAQAVKDYHPSDQMCRIGSYMRSLATIEEKVSHDHMALNDILIEKETNRYNVSSALGPEDDLKTRLEQYKTTYCDPKDNNAGLDLLCKHAGGLGATNKQRVNKDVDFARSLDYPYTIDIDFADSTMTDDEADIIALGQNLYWHDVFSYMKSEQAKEKSKDYMKARQMLTLNNLAHNSFTKQAAMKAKAKAPTAGIEPGWAYMKTMLRELGLADSDIESMIGDRPSYYAQMDVLTKKIYQNPDFYTNLYDKPTNVDRVGAAIEAIALMQMRDHYEATLRREMLMSGLIEAELIPDVETLRGQMLDLK